MKKTRWKINATKANKPLPTPKLRPSDCRIKLTLMNPALLEDPENQSEFIDLYISKDDQIEYIKAERVGERVTNLLEAGVAWPDEQTMVIGNAEKMLAAFVEDPDLQEIVQVLPVVNVEIEKREEEINPDVIIFPGKYLHSLESYSSREVRKGLLM